MEGKTKGVLVAVLAVVGLGWLVSRGKVAPGGLSAGISVAIYDMAGNLVPANSPATLVAGFWYTARVTVTNTSTQGGAGVANTLLTALVVRIAGIEVLNPGARSDYYGASQALQFDYSFYVDTAYAGTSGTATASVYSQTFALLNTAVEVLDIAAAPIIPSAFVTVGAF